MKALPGAVIFAAAWLWPGAAQALDIKGGANAELGGRYGYVFDRGDADPRDHIGMLGIGIRGLVSDAAVQYAVGLDVRLLAAAPGLGSRLVLFPAGVGVTLGHQLKLALLLGAGTSGGGGLPWSGVFPAELWCDAGAAGPLWISGYLRPSWATAGDRHAGSRTLSPIGSSFFDEFDAGLKLRLASGRKMRFGGGRYRNASGYYLALDYGERLGSRSLSIGLGYALSLTAQ